MYCQSCGIAIAHSMKYCNRCGTLQISASDAVETRKSEKRFDDYLDGLFWITAFGVALTAGGMALLKKLQFNDGMIGAFMVLSATAFLINFVLNLWIALGLARKVRASKGPLPLPKPETNELPVMNVSELQAAPSVTENTTRSFEPIYNKRNSD